GLDDEHPLDVAAAAQDDAQDASGLGGGLEHDGPASIAKENAGATVLPVDEPAQSFAGHDEDAPVGAGLDELAADGQSVQEATARGIEIEGTGPVRSQLLLDQAGGRRQQVVRRGGGTDDQVEIAGREARDIESLVGCAETHAGSRLVGGSDVTLADA